MATTYLSDLRTQVRKDLHDTDNTAYRWTDDQLARHIERALQEFSEASPITATLDITTVAGQRGYALTATALHQRPGAIVAVEYPYTVNELPTFAQYRLWSDTLFILTTDAPATGETIRVWYTTPHTLSESVKTLAPEDEPIVQLGAAGYAARELESYNADRITISKFTTMDYRKFADQALSAFYALLQNRIRQRAQSVDSRQVWDTSTL
jgi:hypothetical protein